MRDPLIGRLSYFHPDSGFVRSERAVVMGSLLSSGIVFASRGSPTRWDGVVDADGATLELVPEEGGAWEMIRRYHPTEGMVSIPNRPIRVREAPFFSAGIMAVGIPYWPAGAWALDPTGSLWRKEDGTNAYVLHKLRFDGDSLIVVAVDRPAVTIPEAERDSTLNVLVERLGRGAIDESRIPLHRPIVEGLSVDDRARLWVRVASPDGVPTFDVIESDGRHVGTAVIDFLPARQVRPVVRGDHFYAVFADEFGVPYVVRGVIRPERSGEPAN